MLHGKFVAALKPIILNNILFDSGVMMVITIEGTKFNEL